MSIQFRRVTSAFSYLLEPEKITAEGVIANPEITGEEENLTTIKINNKNYIVGGMEIITLTDDVVEEPQIPESSRSIFGTPVYFGNKFNWNSFGSDEEMYSAVKTYFIDEGGYEEEFSKGVRTTVNSLDDYVKVILYNNESLAIDKFAEFTAAQDPSKAFAVRLGRCYYREYIK